MTETPSRGQGRRQFLTILAAVAGTTTVAGCFGLGGHRIGGQHGATDVLLYNLMAEPATVSVTITESDSDDPHTARTLTLTEGETVNPVNRGKLPTNGSYLVEVDVENGPSETYDWSDPDLELAPLYILIDDSQNIKFLLHAG